jgi:hypothetical protein
MNPPDGMVPRIPARTGKRMLFGKMFLWRLRMGLSQSAVILDTVFDSISPEQPAFYASISELRALTAETIKSKQTLLAARDELIEHGLIIVVRQCDESVGNRPTLYWRFMPAWAAEQANIFTETEKVEKFWTRGSPKFAPPIRGESQQILPLREQIRIDKRRGEMADAGASAPAPISDVRRISLERRIIELRTDIPKAVKRNDQERAEALHAELAAHQTALGFTPDKPPVLRRPAVEPTELPRQTPEEASRHEEAAARVRQAFQEFKSKLGRTE